MKDIFKEYWWLSIMTIPLLAFVCWLFRRLATSKPVRIIAEVNRLTFLKVVLLAVILNFGVWGVGTVALHGDALNGKVENNRYFLQWKGQYTEVTRGTYLYSWMHTYVTIATVPLIIALLGIADIRRRKIANDKNISANK